MSITVRGSPDLRPIVVSFSTGMFAARQPALPALSVSMTRWTAFIAFSVKSVGM